MRPPGSVAPWIISTRRENSLPLVLVARKLEVEQPGTGGQLLLQDEVILAAHPHGAVILAPPASGVLANADTIRPRPALAELTARRRDSCSYRLVDAQASGTATDDGDWVRAHLDRHDEAPRAWTQWSVEVDIAPGPHRLAVRAVDEAGQGQPERPDGLWNFAGYLSVAWHRIAVTAR